MADLSSESADPSHVAAVDHLVEKFAREPGGLLPLLHSIQDALGHVPASAVPVIAQGLNLSRAEVHGVVTYYHFFRSHAPGRQVVQVCQAESCKACGADELMAQAETLLRCKSHTTRADGAVTLEPVYCLGLCAMSPAMMVNETPHARMNSQKLQRLAAEIAP